MANRQGDVDLREAQVSAPQLTLWLGLDCSWKAPALLSSYRPISLLDTVDKLFEKILLNRILYEVSQRGLMRDEQFGFRPRHCTSLQLVRLVL